MFPLALLNASSPPSPPVDPALTLALLHFDGADGSTTFTDSSPVPLTYERVYVNNTISTTQSKFGGASLFVGIDTSSGVKSSGTNDRFVLGNSDFTIECWFYTTSIDSVNRGIIGFADRHGIKIQNGLLSAAVYTGAYSVVTNTNAVLANTWNHVAVVRQSTLLKLYVNGVGSTSNPNIGTDPLVNDGNNYLRVTQGTYQGGVISSISGFIDEARFRKEAVYTADFTPPTAPFTY